MLRDWLTKGMGAPVPVTDTWTAALPPTDTGKVAPFVEARVKLWLVAVTVRLTLAVLVAVPLVPVTVTDCAAGGNAMLAAVAIVSITVDGEAGLPLRGTLVGLKLQSAPAGRPLVQLPGVEAVELVKLTVPLKPLMGVMVIVDVVICPAGMLAGVKALADMVKGTVTVIAVGADIEALWAASPS